LLVHRPAIDLIDADVAAAQAHDDKIDADTDMRCLVLDDTETDVEVEAQKLCCDRAAVIAARPNGSSEHAESIFVCAPWPLEETVEENEAVDVGHADADKEEAHADNTDNDDVEDDDNSDEVDDDDDDENDEWAMALHGIMLLRVTTSSSPASSSSRPSSSSCCTSRRLLSTS
jgi:hypothetical protein